MTIRIAICDDEEDARQILLKYAKQYQKESSGENTFEVDVYVHPDDLLRACEKKKYHLFLLDILMPMQNGIDSAREIQRGNPTAFFVFCTASRDYPINAYKLNAIHYLIKPIGYTDFQTAMSRFFSRFETSSELRIRIPDINAQVTECTVHELLYIDVEGKYCQIHLLSGEIIRIRNSIKRLEEVLSGYPMLLRMGGSFLLNLMSIRKIEGNKLLLKNRECLFIPRNALAETRKRYIDYYNR